MQRYLALLIFCLWTPHLLFADRPYFLTVGPEIYRFIREREGGTHQEGQINGVRVAIDRMKCNGIYLGVDYLYAKGPLKGATATGRPLRSELTDQIVEGRLGLTLQQKYGRCPFITPYVGWGYFHEINDFFRPSPLPCKFTDTFNYIAAGFLSGVNFTPLLSMGINFKLRFMQEATSEVSDDPLFDDVTLSMKEEIHVRVEVPFAYTPCSSLFGTGFLLSPFFEFRHFGGREGFPFNFKDTKFYLYGARFALTYHF
jgi:hypothetical protein